MGDRVAAQPRWTPDQRRAIEARGHTVLVSAAAGSGKTAVLTERAVRRMLDSLEPIAADRLLVVTFTRAAAKEMKQRMVKKLAEQIAADPENATARRQRQLLDRAIIGTIDSLCLELLRQHWQQLGLPAAFRVGDSQELALMREEAVSQALEAAYAEDSEVFRALTALLSERRGDRSLAGTVLQVLDFSRTHPFYANWLAGKLALYEGFSNPVESVWGLILTEYADETVERLLGLADAGIALIGSNPDFENYLPAFSEDRAFLGRLWQASEARDWDICRALLVGYAPARLKALKKGAEPEGQLLLKRQRGRIKEGIAKLRDQVYCCELTGFFEDIEDLTPKLRCLFTLVLETDRLLLEEKIARGVFDFSDLEQFAVLLLMEETQTGITRTALAQELSASFDEIMVDEYQDVNAVQDMIITALSNGNNLFLVGDVKQSIYRFRQAQPELFLRRSEAYGKRDPHSAPKEAPELITLGGNFRSREAVTEAINCIFSPLMSKRIGELVYDESHRLEAMATFPEDSSAGVELRLFEQGGLSAAEGLLAEAQRVAELVQSLIEQKALVSDGGETRVIEPRDIAVLLRSPKNRADRFAAALEERGIEAFTISESGFLTTREIAAVLQLLRALRNPTLDIALIGAMLSPLFGFSNDELAAVRLTERKGSFYLALKLAAAEQERVAAFLELFESLRRRSLTLSVSALLTEILQRTGFELCCLAMPNGRQRQANLLLLSRLADDYHRRGIRGLSPFLRMIDRLEEQGEDLPGAYVGEGQNAVTITSIHRSKGLEWPVVLVADAGREHSLYKHDLRAPIILHSELGFASVRRDERLKKQFVTVPLEAVRCENERATLSEELRVLYVAMTRAKERLIVVATDKKLGEMLDGCDSDARCGALTPAEAREGRSYAAWMLMALARYGSLSKALRFETPLAGVRLQLCYLQQEMEQRRAAKENAAPLQEQLSLFSAPATPLPIEPDAQLEQALVERVSFVYPHQAATHTPAKLSVSELVHDKGMGGENAFRTTPAFLEGESAATGAQRGSAAHAFLQYCDFSAARADAPAELQRLRQAGILPRRQADLVDLGAIRAFFQSKLAARIFASPKVLREFAFMASAQRCPSASHLATEEGEAPMLQGIADCIFFEGEGAVLLDYKTDRVSDASILVERYQKQLLLYREMLLGVLPQPIVECRLWSFALRCDILVYSPEIT